MTISNNEAVALIESYATEAANSAEPARHGPIGINGLTTLDELGVTLGDDFDAMVAEESGCDCAFDQTTRDGWTCVADVLESMSEIGVVEDEDGEDDYDGDDEDANGDDDEEDDGDDDDEDDDSDLDNEEDDVEGDSDEADDGDVDDTRNKRDE